MVWVRFASARHARKSTPSSVHLLQRLSAQEEPEDQPALLREAEPLVGRASLPGRRVRPSIDDDLFEDAPLALDRFAGARR